MENNKKILVTGAGGYIGRHVVKWLLDSNYNVLAVDFNIDGIDNRAERMKINIFDEKDDLYESLGKPDICLHMAWKDGFVHNSPEHMNNLSSHYKFIMNLINNGLKHISILGTMHEIGYWEGEVDSETPTVPYSLYGIAKNSLRQSLEVSLKEKDVVFQWLRVFYILGDDTKNNSIFSKIIEFEADGKEKFPFTTGKNKYDFIEISQLAEYISKVILQDKINGIINCSSGIPVSLKDKVEEFIERNEFKIKPEYGVFPERKYDSPAMWGNNEKILDIVKKNNREEENGFSNR